MVWTAGLAVLAPLSGLLLGRLFHRGERAVIGNVELFSWFLSPLGLAYLFFGGAFAAFAAGLRYAGIFHIVSDSRRGRPVYLGRPARSGLSNPGSGRTGSPCSWRSSPPRR